MPPAYSVIKDSLFGDIYEQLINEPPTERSPLEELSSIPWGPTKAVPLILKNPERD